MSIGFRVRSALAGRSDASPAQLAVARPALRARSIDLALVRQATVLWLISRIVLAVFTYFALPFAAQGPTAPANFTRTFTPHTLLHAWAEWDTGWYMAIALHGYDPLRAAFFPLYPFFVHLVDVGLGPLHIVLAALIVSNLATLGAFVGIALLTAELFGSAAGGYAVMALAAYPVAFFTATGYSDSLLLAFAAFTLLFAIRGEWKVAAACAALATLARPLALALILPLLWEYGRRYFDAHDRFFGFGNVRVLGAGAALGAVIPLTLVCWGVYCWRVLGNPLAYVVAQNKYWHHTNIMPWNAIGVAIQTLQSMPAGTFAQARVLVDMGPVAVVIVLAILAARYLPVSLSLYMAAVILILLTSAVPHAFDPFMAEARYTLMAAPVFVALGGWMSRRQWLQLFVLGAGFMTQAVFTSFFLRGGWII